MAAPRFVGRLIDGIPQSGYFEKGFKNLYLLHDVTIEHAPIRASFAEDYEEAIDKAVRDSSKTFDLAIVDCHDDSRDIPESKNPYLRAKARLMAHGIPMQGIKTTHLRGNEYSHKFSLGPTALQMYAKMGGIPWVLPASQSVDHELVVGIESTIRRENYWAGVEQSRVVGITTFFLGDGTYVLGQEVKTVPYEGYLAELVNSLVKSLKEVADTYWKKGRQVRIVFHVFKPLKGIEIDAVSEVVKKFPDYNITFAFVTISQDHPWLLFQDAKRQERGWHVTPCDRGQNLAISNHECLLQIQGPRDRPNKAQRPSSPVLIRLHEQSTYKDLHYISQQILDFAFICWRSYFPIHQPVTQFYAQRIAKISEQLAQTPNWNPAIISSHFRRKQWFL